jgi:hypothetical protein
MRTYETPVLIKREALATITAEVEEDHRFISPF